MNVEPENPAEDPGGRKQPPLAHETGSQESGEQQKTQGWASMSPIIEYLGAQCMQQLLHSPHDSASFPVTYSPPQHPETDCRVTCPCTGYAVPLLVFHLEESWDSEAEKPLRVLERKSTVRNKAMDGALPQRACPSLIAR